MVLRQINLGIRRPAGSSERIKMVELVLSRIKVDENRNEQVIVLREREGKRLLPVVIGVAEVNAIKLKLSGIEPPRPLTHDLLLKTIGELGGSLKSVLIDHMDNNTFYAKLILARAGDEIRIDARPSDSIAVALRANAPIYAEEEVMKKAGVSEN